MEMNKKCRVCHRHISESDQRQHRSFSTSPFSKPTLWSGYVRARSRGCITATFCTLGNKKTTDYRNKLIIIRI